MIRACWASFGRAGPVAQHEEADRLHAQPPRLAEVLDGDVGLGAVGGDPGDRGACLVRPVQVVDGPEPGQHEDGDLGLRRLVDGRPDELESRRPGEAVVEARAAEAVAVAHLDDLHAGGVERVDYPAHLLLGELVGHRVRTVAQRRVGDPQVALATTRARRARSLGAHLGLGRRSVTTGASSGRIVMSPMSGSNLRVARAGVGELAEVAEDFQDVATPSGGRS
jgi:hypothetical protein